MATVRYFWNCFIHRGTTLMYLQYLFSNVWKALYTNGTSIFINALYWPPYWTDKFISYVVSGPSQWFFHFGEVIVVVVVVFDFTTFLTSQVISVALYNERGKSDKFCSETLISASGSFTCHKSTTRDPRLYFPSEESHTQDFYALKKIHRPRPGLNLRTSFQWRVW